MEQGERSVTPAERLAQRIVDAPRAWPGTVTEQARLAFVDTAACILMGSTAGPVSNICAVAAQLMPGTIPSPVPGKQPLSAAGYALVAATAAHALDYDDVFEPALSHASAVLVPAILAASTLAPVSGDDLLSAFIIAIDAQAFIAQAVNYAHYSAGWHSTSTIGAPSAAAAVAHLLHLDARQAATAVSLAISMAAGSKRQFGTDAKPFHAGMAAHAGIVAALLARGGASASHDMLDGPWSFRDLYNGNDGPGFGHLPSGDTDCALAKYGLWAKPYPCCASTHRPIDAVLTLIADMGLSGRDVRSARARVSPVAAANLMYPAPQTTAEARFSMNHCLAAALLHGAVEPSAFDPATIEAPEFVRMRDKVTMEAEPSFSPCPDEQQPERAEVTLTLADGSEASHEITDPIGHPRNPMVKADYLEKFTACARHVVPEARAEQIVATLLGLGSAPFSLSYLGAP
jgi:2-methylcitrate dehydratase PrpD